MQEKRTENYLISDNEKKYIQVIKIILCVLVVFVHSFRDDSLINIQTFSFNSSSIIYFIKDFVSHVICNCAVPGFFLISSVLLYKKNFKWNENIKKKIKSLLIPYILLNTFWILFYIVFQSIPQFSKYFSTESTIIANWNLTDWINAYLGIEGYPLLYPLWFIKNLFILNLISPIIKKVCNKIPITFLTIIILAFIWNLKIPFSILSTGSLLYFTIGYLIVNNNIHIDDLNKINTNIMVFLYPFLCVLYYIVSNTIISRMLLLVIDIISLIIIFKTILKIKGNLLSKLILIAPYSFAIYLFHEFSLTIFVKVCTIVIPQNNIINLIEYFTLPFFTIIYCIILSIILKKFLPKLYCVLTGDRRL